MKLDEIIRETFALPAGHEIRDEQGPGDLTGWDSLGHVNLMNALEQKFSISMDMDEMMGIEKVADIRRLLTTKGVAAF